MREIYCGLIVACLCIQSIIAQQQNITRRSYERAREVLDKAVAAYGGVEKLRGLENFSLRAVGDTVQRNQSRRTFMSEKTPYQIDVTVDMKNNRFVQIAKGGYPGGFAYHTGLAVEKAEGVSFDLIRSTSTARPNIPPAAMRARMRWIPQYWVINALDRASRLRFAGKTDFDKRPHPSSATPTMTARKSLCILTRKPICSRNTRFSEPTFLRATRFLKRFTPAIETKTTSKFRLAERRKLLTKRPKSCVLKN